MFAMSLFIVSLLQLLAPADGKSSKPKTGAPLPPDGVTFTGPTQPMAGEWLVDTDKGDASVKVAPKDDERGVTYYYHCGRSSAPIDFNDEACYNIMPVTGCSDNRDNPFKNGEATVCAASMEYNEAEHKLSDKNGTGVKVFKSLDQRNKARPKAWKEACAWLGGRCKNDFVDSMTYILEGTEVRDKPISVNIDTDAFGAVFLYKT